MELTFLQKFLIYRLDRLGGFCLCLASGRYMASSIDDHILLLLGCWLRRSRYCTRSLCGGEGPRLLLLRVLFRSNSFSYYLSSFSVQNIFFNKNQFFFLFSIKRKNNVLEIFVEFFSRNFYREIKNIIKEKIMEYERQIFRVHERLISSEKCKHITKIISILLLFTGFLNFLLVLYSHLFFSRGSGMINSALDEYHKNLTVSGVYYPPDFNKSDINNLKFENITVEKKNHENRLRILDNQAIDSNIQKAKSKKDEIFTEEKFYKKLKKKFGLGKGEILNSLNKTSIEKKYHGKFLKIYEMRDSLIKDTDIVKINFVLKYNKTISSDHKNILPYEAINNKTKKIKSYIFSKNKFRVMLYMEEKERYIDPVHNIYIDYKHYKNSLPWISKLMKSEPIIIMDIIHSYK